MLVVVNGYISSAKTLTVFCCMFVHGGRRSLLSYAKQYCRYGMEVAMLANKTDAAFFHVATETGMGAPLWFPSLHGRNLCPNTANKIRTFVKQLKMSTFPAKAFWPSFAYDSGEDADPGAV